jgi:dephospho-CoA kinase
MLVIGLTGSIGMGKSAVAACFARRGVPVCDADREVHRLYEGDAVAAIEAVFPGVAPGGKIDRGLLAEAIAGRPERLKRLEAIVHPLVVNAEIAFLRDAETKGAEMALLEIPLLFEAGAEERVDVTVVVHAPKQAQKARVLARPGMSEAKFEALLARQFPDALKLARADYIVDTGGGLADLQPQVDRILQQLKGREGSAMARLNRLRAD